MHLNYIKARLVVTPVEDGVNLDGGKAPLSIKEPEATLKGPHSSNLPAAQHRQLHALGTTASLISINDLKEAAERCAAITGLGFGAAVVAGGAVGATVYSASRTTLFATAWKNKVSALLVAVSSVAGTLLGPGGGRGGRVSLAQSKQHRCTT